MAEAWASVIAGDGVGEGADGRGPRKAGVIGEIIK